MNTWHRTLEKIGEARAEGDGDVINGTLVRPYIDTSTMGPGTIQPAPLPDPGPLDSRRETAVGTLIGKVSDPVRKRMQCILQPFPTGTLEALSKNGVAFEITKQPSAAQQAMSKGGLQMLGGYNPLSKKIQFMESTLLSDLGPHTVVHELCHAVDHMRGERGSVMARIPGLKIVQMLKGTALESGRDKEIRTLYHEYQARANVEDVDVMRRELIIANDMNKSLPAQMSIVSDFDHWGLRPVKYERKDGQEIFSIEPAVASKKSATKKLAVTAAIAAGGCALSSVLGPVPAVIGGLVFGVTALGQVRQMLAARSAQKTEVEVEMMKGAKAHVVQQDERAVVTVPEGARSYTGETWSDYAHRGNMGQENRGAAEYVAEAYSTYLEGGDKAQRFLDNDPKMYHFVEQRLRDEFNRHP